MSLVSMFLSRDNLDRNPDYLLVMLHPVQLHRL